MTEKSKKTSKKLFFSGVQPTGDIHIGNYLGAIKQWVDLLQSGEYEGIVCVVDYHAITVPYEQENLKTRILNAATSLMACGVTPENSLLFVQSQVPEHTELTWIFNCSTMMGELSRMTQFKDKSKGKGESVSVGLFDYPVLQSADIALYKAGYVPVGEDQLQHLELAREIVRRFNKCFGDVFPEPKEILGKARRILGLDGEKKMSKSLENYIALTESPESIWKKLAPAKTDERRKRRKDPGIPTDCNIYNSYHKYFSSPQDLEEIDKGCRSAGMGCFDCKKLLAKNMETVLGPIREKYEEYTKNPEIVQEFLSNSAKKCRKIAKKTMEEVHKKIGLR